MREEALQPFRASAAPRHRLSRYLRASKAAGGRATAEKSTSLLTRCAYDTEETPAHASSFSAFPHDELPRKPSLF